MMKRDIRLNGLFLEYGEERFLNWCRSLTIFRFCKSHPYPDDLAPDRFIAIINFENREELVEILGEFNISFKERHLDVYLKQVQAIVLSDNAEIQGSNCYVSINEVTMRIEIEVFGIKDNPFALSDETFQRAKEIDDYLNQIELKFCSSPNDDDYCITRDFYPEVWENAF